MYERIYHLPETAVLRSTAVECNQDRADKRGYRIEKSKWRIVLIMYYFFGILTYGGFINE